MPRSPPSPPTITPDLPEVEMPKITLVGAGSTVFAKNLLGDIVNVPLYAFDRVEKKMQRLVHTAEKLGLPVPMMRIHERTDTHVKVQLVGQAPVMRGWELVAVADMRKAMRLPDGPPFVIAVDGCSVPDDVSWRLCDACKIEPAIACSCKANHTDHDCQQNACQAWLCCDALFEDHSLVDALGDIDPSFGVPIVSVAGVFDPFDPFLEHGKLFFHTSIHMHAPRLSVPLHLLLQREQGRSEASPCRHHGSYVDLSRSLQIGLHCAFQTTHQMAAHPYRIG